MDRKFFGLILLFLLACQEGVMYAEARLCYSQSQEFRGICIRTYNCASICKSEGFESGLCKWSGILHRQCMCYKECGSGSPGGGPPSPPGGGPPSPPGDEPPSPPGDEPPSPPGDEPPSGPSPPGDEPPSPPGGGPPSPPSPPGPKFSS